MDCSWKRVFFVFLSLAPLLGESCSCFHFSDRSETLSDGICDGEVYSGVVVGATCSCLEGTDLVDCREYSFSESNNAYSAEVLRRVKLNVSHSFGIIKTCPQAAETLAPGSYLAARIVRKEWRGKAEQERHYLCSVCECYY